MYAPYQRETTLQCDVVFHWLGAYTKWSMYMYICICNNHVINVHNHNRLLFNWKQYIHSLSTAMITSPNWNIFRFTSTLCGEFTGHRWIPLINANDVLMFSLICAWQQLGKHWRPLWFETPSRSLWRHCNETSKISGYGLASNTGTFSFMMTSSNGNIFRVTAPLWGECTDHRWIPPHKGQWRGALTFSLICA